MARSMTGYGKGGAASGELAFTAELRAVNARGREVRCRLPQALAPFEAKFRERVQQVVLRGRVDLTVAFEGGNPSRTTYRVDPEALETLAQAWRDAAASLGVDEPPRVASLLQLPGAIESVPQEGADEETLFEVAAAACDDALTKFDASRRVEGEKLVADLSRRAASMTEIHLEVEALTAETPARLAAALRERVREILDEIPLDENRLAQEIALAATRADVTEEHVRLRAHLERLVELVRPEIDEIGRGSEFLVQEIRREVNTLGVKAGDPRVDEKVLQLKSELEKIREQSANLE